MPKKTKRQARKTPAPSAIAPAQVAAVTTAVPQSAGPSRLTTVSEFNPDYTYVVKDLRRIAILATSFVVVLIALSFFI